ncbi:DUF3631 domain-containing protein [Catellatospora citrea]|uniref:DUF3631 domain-containing protein n=1 Tax=Catellatospora citrea TaxID=53366 RepID=A0A8J3KE46_9ACTN|nr:DUF3631 domain-containing protein [Catellatospora citrea]RKE08860.1 uncharacterized protein DUF3631 [Catellatospora citrea]GIG01268.1 hypothetical protein Cci01nite_63610 [Catellatospora citrea]
MTRPKKDRPAVDGAALLDRLRATIAQYVILPSGESLDAVVLWIAATYALPAWACAPRLVIRAPEKRCGKSRLLDLVEAACHNPLITVNASPAAVYRAIGTDNPPTLLIDEYDTIFGPAAAGSSEDLRGLLNAGHQRNRPALRYDANTQRVEKIATFAMAAMAGIGAAPDTIEDRAVVVHMRRRAGREKVKPWRIMRDRPMVEAIGAELSAWLLGNLDVLRAAEPIMPVEDRAADTWEPLIALADLAGGDWPIRARTAAVTLTGAKEENGATSDRVRLLTDCRSIFTTADADALPTADIIAQLRAMDESPWPDITPHRLGVMLREFEVRSAGNIRFPTGQAKGYTRASFADAWDRYCAPDVPRREGEPSQPSQPSPPSSEAGRFPGWDGSNRPTKTTVPGLTSDGTVGTVGTVTPLPTGHLTPPAHAHLRIVRPDESATGTE